MKRGSGERIRPPRSCCRTTRSERVGTLLLFGSQQDERTAAGAPSARGRCRRDRRRAHRRGGPHEARRPRRPLRGHPDADASSCSTATAGSGPGEGRGATRRRARRARRPRSAGVLTNPPVRSCHGAEAGPGAVREARTPKHAQRRRPPSRSRSRHRRARPIAQGLARCACCVAGASGLIGTALRAAAARRPGTPCSGSCGGRRGAEHEFSWAPDAKILDFRLLESVDAVINLSGASLNRMPWTARYKEQILRSRVKATQALVEAMAMTASPPPIFLSGSAVGLSTATGPARRSPRSRPAARASSPTSCERVGGRRAARPRRRRAPCCCAPASCSPPGRRRPEARCASRPRFGLGATGSPPARAQHWPWISLHDEVAAIVPPARRSELEGPVNLAGPTPAAARADHPPAGHRSAPPAPRSSIAARRRSSSGWASSARGAAAAEPERSR